MEFCMFQLIYSIIMIIDVPYWSAFSLKETTPIPNFCLKIVNFFKVDFLELQNSKDYQFDVILKSWAELVKNGQTTYDSYLWRHQNEIH